MFAISDAYLQELIAEDIPYVDLTSHLLGIGETPGLISYYTREDCVLCGSEEAARILDMLGAEVTELKPSGTHLCAGDTFLVAKGLAGSLHAAWKVCLNIFDHYSAVSTKASRMVKAAQEVKPGLPVLTTRKSMPGTKPLMTKAVMVGGAVPHRLGLSETVLVFDNHTAFIGGFDGLLKALPALCAASCEKKVFVEANAAQAKQLAHLAAEAIGLYSSAGNDNAETLKQSTLSGTFGHICPDGIQFDKISPDELHDLVPELRCICPSLTLIAAGGINEANVAKYAATGVDGLATTALFTAKPLDMSAKIVAI